MSVLLSCYLIFFTLNRSLYYVRYIVAKWLWFCTNFWLIWSVYTTVFTLSQTSYSCPDIPLKITHSLTHSLTHFYSFNEWLICTCGELIDKGSRRSGKKQWRHWWRRLQLLLLLLQMMMLRHLRFGQHLCVGLGKLHAQDLRQLRVEADTLQTRRSKLCSPNYTTSICRITSRKRIAS